MAIRAGKQPDSGLVQRLLAMFSGGLYAAPHRQARHGDPLEPADLARHQCLRFPPGFDDVWELRHAHEIAAPRQTAIRPMAQRLAATRPARNHAASA